MRIIERLQLAVGGLANGVFCGLAGALSVCALGGMVLPKLDPEFNRLASADLFLLISLGSALTGFAAGLVGGQRVFRAFCALSLGGPLSLGFAIRGLFLGAPAGFLIRLAMGAFGQFAEHPLIGYAEHDILVGCEVGMIAGALAAVRLFLWPPAWMRWARWAFGRSRSVAASAATGLPTSTMASVKRASPGAGGDGPRCRIAVARTPSSRSPCTRRSRPTVGASFSCGRTVPGSLSEPQKGPRTMSEDSGQRCILPPPLPDPPEVRRRPRAAYTLAARTAHLVAREAVRAFHEGDRGRFLGALDALVELASDPGRCGS